MKSYIVTELDSKARWTLLRITRHVQPLRLLLQQMRTQRVADAPCPLRVWRSGAETGHRLESAGRVHSADAGEPFASSVQLRDAARAPCSRPHPPSSGPATVGGVVPVAHRSVLCFRPRAGNPE